MKLLLIVMLLIMSLSGSTCRENTGKTKTHLLNDTNSEGNHTPQLTRVKHFA